jgi:hypothetical protein
MVASAGLPGFGIGTMLACFHIKGILACEIDKFKREVR